MHFGACFVRGPFFLAPHLYNLLDLPDPGKEHHRVNHAVAPAHVSAPGIFPATRPPGAPSTLPFF